jgi:hypothetical protein
MDQLMVEVLEELADRELLPNEAAQVMKLAGTSQRPWFNKHIDDGDAVLKPALWALLTAHHADPTV